MKQLEEKEREELERFLEANEDAIDQNFWRYRKAVAEEKDPVEQQE